MANFPAIQNLTDLSAALNDHRIADEVTVGVDFLKMDFDTGEWFLGQNADIVTDEEILIDTTTIQHGWILWSGNRPQKKMVPFNQDMPMPMDPIGEDEPSEGRSFQGALIDDGSPLSFDTNSGGGRKGVKALLDAIMAQNATGSKYLYPKVKLTSNNYPGTGKRSGKTNHNPQFDVIAWCNRDGEEEPSSAPAVEDQSADVEETAEKPKRQRRQRKSAA